MTGILLVDKPKGITSHDVVSRARRALGTRKVGHAGTLDPMATGLLILGSDSSTRLLTFLVGLGKTYEATIRLGQSSDTDDAEGELSAVSDTSQLSRSEIDAGISALVGEISQVPSTFSAIKVDGKRSYELARSGEAVALKPRVVTVSRFEVLAERRSGPFTELDAVIDCSSGT
ncbi:MAG: tRNA pseudouridine(55) synthase TruB, partial [Actinomycetota bacterium]|nr:tRNA pseudouridine(55) synthase TruB [Actinomycetota bacterium]